MLYYLAMKLKKFFLIVAAALLLIASSGLRFWQDVDMWLFRLLNDSVKESFYLQTFWALANVKICDLFGAFFIVTFSIIARLSLIQILYYLIWFEIGIFSVKELISPLLFLRDSPTLICENPFLLSQIIPWLKIKDSSHWSFPSDHAFIVLEWVGFMFFYKGARIGILALISSSFFIFPRLVGGAHWATDVLLGSLPLALLFVAVSCYTPLYTYFTSIFRKRHHATKNPI